MTLPCYFCIFLGAQSDDICFEAKSGFASAHALALFRSLSHFCCTFTHAQLHSPLHKTVRNPACPFCFPPHDELLQISFSIQYARRLLAEFGGPLFGPIFRDTFRSARTDNGTVRYHSEPIEKRPEKWTQKRSHNEVPKTGPHLEARSLSASCTDAQHMVLPLQPRRLGSRGPQKLSSGWRPVTAPTAS